MEEVEHVSEDSFSDDEKEHVVLDSVEEGKIDEKKKVEVMEVPDLEEHEKRYKRPARVTTMNVTPTSLSSAVDQKCQQETSSDCQDSFGHGTRRVVATIRPGCFSCHTKLVARRFCQILKLSSISRCSADTLAHAARLEVYHPPY